MTLTPEQFNKIAMKDDLDRVENKVDVLSQNVSTLLSAMDGLTKKVENFQAELAADRSAHDRVDAKLSAHDMRIGVVEKKLQTV